jgi:DmsE family decaheme c-type cytochrome
MKPTLTTLACLLAAATLLGFLSLQGHAQINPETPAPQYVANDPATCLICHASSGDLGGESILHGAHGFVGNPASPFSEGQGGCQSCHGPSQAHMRLDAAGNRPPTPIVFDKRVPAQQQDAVCLGCHEADTGHFWPGSVHEFAEVSCAGCHKLHDAVDQALTFEGKNTQCLGCHQRQQAEMLFASSHPMRSRQMVCTDCHAAHGGPGPAALIQPTLNEQCYTCHAEKRGPFLWEHAPVAEDCSNCHKAHGSNHRSLLQARTPFLCQQCHLAAFHPSNAESGIGIPPRGASANLLGRDCANCHFQVHGSNHPSGAGLTR